MQLADPKSSLFLTSLGGFESNETAAWPNMQYEIAYLAIHRTMLCSLQSHDLKSL